MQRHVHVWMRCRIHAGFVVIVSGEEQSVRVRVLGPRFGFLMGSRFPYLIRSQEVCMSRRGLVHKEVSLRGFPRYRNMELGVLWCPLPLFILISLLCYLGQAVKLEGNWGGHRWREQTGLMCGFSGVPFKGRIFFLPLPYLVTGLGRGRTTQRGRSQGIPRARVHMRMGMSRATHWKTVLATVSRSVEGCRTPDEAMVCRGRSADGCGSEPLSGR